MITVQIILLASALPLLNSLSLTNYNMQITTLARYAIKGLSPDLLHTVHIANSGETFPDDRRFGLLTVKERNLEGSEEDKNNNEYIQFNPNQPEWLHKENFVCAFTAPELMASLDSEYKIISNHIRSNNVDTDKCNNKNRFLSFGLPNDHYREDVGTQRLLTIWKRQIEGRVDPPILGPIDLATTHGRSELSTFFTNLVNEKVICVTKDDRDNTSNEYEKTTLQHTHQFGNTRSGVKFNNGDTRTVHIINAATVRQFSEKIGVTLNPLRFRPNIIIDGLEPWKEFDLVGSSLHLRKTSCHDDNTNCHSQENNDDDNQIKFDIISTTVRCAGVGIDPFDPASEKLDIPSLLIKHFPEHGPYLGVYAIIKEGGKLSVGDVLSVDK